SSRRASAGERDPLVRGGAAEPLPPERQLDDRRQVATVDRDRLAVAELRQLLRRELRARLLVLRPRRAAAPPIRRLRLDLDVLVAEERDELLTRRLVVDRP